MTALNKSNLDGMDQTVAMNNLDSQQKSLLQDLTSVFPTLDEVDLFNACQQQNWNPEQVSSHLLNLVSDERREWKVSECKRRKKPKEGEPEKPPNNKERKRNYARSSRRTRNRFKNRNRNGGRRKNKDKKKGGQESNTQNGVLIPKQKSVATSVSWASKVKQPKVKAPPPPRPSPNRKSAPPESSSSPQTDRSKENNNQLVPNVVDMNSSEGGDIGAPPGLGHSSVWTPIQNDTDPILDSPETGGFGVADSEFPFDNQTSFTNQNTTTLAKSQLFPENNNQATLLQDEKKDIQLFTDPNPNQPLSYNNTNNNNNNKNETNSSFSDRDHEVASIASQYSRPMDHPIKEQGYQNDSEDQRPEFRNNHEIEFRPLPESGNEFQPDTRGHHYNESNVLAEYDRVTMPANIPFAQDNQTRPSNQETFPPPTQPDPQPPPPSTQQRNPTNTSNGYELHPHIPVTMPDETFHFENNVQVYSFGVDVPEDNDRRLQSETPPQHHQMNDMKRGTASQLPPVHMSRNRPPLTQQMSRLDIQSRDMRDPAHHPLPPPSRRSEDITNHHSQIMDPNFIEPSYNNDAYERKNDIDQDPRTQRSMEPQTEHRIHEYNEPNVFSAPKQKEINVKHDRVAPMYPAEEQQHINNMYTQQQNQNMYNQQHPYVPQHTYKHKPQNPYDMNYEESSNGYVPFGMEEKSHPEQEYNQYSPTPDNNQYQQYSQQHPHGLQQTQPSRQPPPPTQPAAEQHFKPHYTAPPHHYSNTNMTTQTTPITYPQHTHPYLTSAAPATAAVFPYATHLPHYTSIGSGSSNRFPAAVGYSTPQSTPVVFPNTHYGSIRPY